MLASVFVEMTKMSIDFKNCSPATLAVAIDFIYGVEVPQDFADL